MTGLFFSKHLTQIKRTLIWTRAAACAVAGLASVWLLAGGCFRPSIPISTGTVYPIDVFMENQSPDRPYQEMEWVEISHQDTLSAKQRSNSERMLYRGISADTKDVLIAQLVLKAQKLGADAMIKVQYKYFTSATVEGYILRGMAVQYRGD